MWIWDERASGIAHSQPFGFGFLKAASESSRSRASCIMAGVVWVSRSYVLARVSHATHDACRSSTTCTPVGGFVGLDFDGFRVQAQVRTWPERLRCTVRTERCQAGDEVEGGDLRVPRLL